MLSAPSVAIPAIAVPLPASTLPAARRGYAYAAVEGWDTAALGWRDYYVTYRFYSDELGDFESCSVCLRVPMGFGEYRKVQSWANAQPCAVINDHCFEPADDADRRIATTEADDVF